MFTENVETGMRTQMLELFSGEGAVSSVFKREGVATVSYDINMAPGKRSMDFLSSCGFASKPYFSYRHLATHQSSQHRLLFHLQVGHALRDAARTQCNEPDCTGLWVMECGEPGYVFAFTNESNGEIKPSVCKPWKLHNIQVVGLVKNIY